MSSDLIPVDTLREWLAGEHLQLAAAAKEILSLRDQIVFLARGAHRLCTTADLLYGGDDLSLPPHRADHL